MSDQEPPQMTKVDLFGTEIELPAETAKSVIAARDDTKRRLAELQQVNESRTAAEEASRLKAEQAEERRVAEEAAAKGQLDQLKSLHQADLQKQAQQIKKLKIQTALGSVESIARTALPDITNALSADESVTLDGDNLIFNRKDGTSVGFNDYLGEYLKDRPHFTVKTVPPGSGAEGSNPPSPDIPEITRAEYDNNRAKYGQALADKKLTIKD